MIFIQENITSQNSLDLPYKKILRANACSIISTDTIDFNILSSNTWLTYAIAKKGKKRKLNPTEISTISFTSEQVIISTSYEKNISHSVEYSESRIIIIPHEKEKIAYDVCELNEKYLKVFVYIYSEGEWKKISKILFIAI